MRGWTAWHRHVTLALLALAVLTVIAAQPSSTTNDRIPLTLPEIRRPLAALVLIRHRSLTDVLHWSHWRRRHQATARHCHYQRRSDP